MAQSRATSCFKWNFRRYAELKRYNHHSGNDILLPTGSEGASQTNKQEQPLRSPSLKQQLDINKRYKLVYKKSRVCIKRISQQESNTFPLGHQTQEAHRIRETTRCKNIIIYLSNTSDQKHCSSSKPACNFVRGTCNWNDAIENVEAACQVKCTVRWHCKVEESFACQFERECDEKRRC